MPSALAILFAAAASGYGRDTSTEQPAVSAAGAERVVVTASPLDRSAFDLAQPVSQLSGLDLKSKQAATLGEALDGEPGISESGFTHGASRPVIRSQADNRVRVLNNGTEVFDASNLSPDHAPSVAPLVSQFIEVVRGPATILYGASANGGVNVIDERIPTTLPDNGHYRGKLVGRMGSVDLERSGAFSLDLALTKHLIFHADGTRFYTDDLQVPGHALSDRLRAENLVTGDRFSGDPRHYVPNTYVQTRDFGVGLSYVWDEGYVGASFGQYLSVYGVTDDPEVDDPAEGVANTPLDLTKRRADLRFSLTDALPYIRTMNFKFNYTDYKHLELDYTEVGAKFLTNGFDARLEFVHRPFGIFEGSVGTQVLLRYLSVVGDEAFLQPTRTVQPAGFFFEEATLLGSKAAPTPAVSGDAKDGKVTTGENPNQGNNRDPTVRFQFGGRIEYADVTINSDDPLLTSLDRGNRRERDFLPLSVSAGLVYGFLKDTNAVLTLSYSERAPTAEELYARGVHDATFQYLVGDAALPKEKQFGVDFSIRRRAGFVTGSLSGFYNRFDDFIDFAPEAGLVGGNRIFDYAPVNADFYGGEALLDFHLLPAHLSRPLAPADPESVRARVTGEDGRETVVNPNDLSLELKGDYVHAEDCDSGASLPRIIPLRVGLALGFTNERFQCKIEGLRVNHQYRVAQYETATPGYTLLNASASYSLPVRVGHGLSPVTTEIFLRGTNLTNEEARNHQSFLKDVLPLPGRNILGGLRLSF